MSVLVPNVLVLFAFFTSFVCLESIRRYGGTAPLIFDLNSRWQLVVRFGPSAFLIVCVCVCVCEDKMTSAIVILEVVRLSIYYYLADIWKLRNTYSIVVGDSLG
jgi:hypothetical protein